ncbi:trypco2 family protein [Streptomyces stackebrandtii]|uniref:trypco2 family protein n=1 Tax=Streptomyces stackebrandtii TaxID=3051177 RepID=UPI0028DD2DD6|nr:trypco2 family protein [Streptomyces sp. DSM 40976]
MSMDIELADLLASLRSELSRARLEAANEDVKFRIDSIDLELQVSVEKSAEANAGVKFWVASLGGKAGAKSGQTHTVRMTLSAEEAATGQKVRTGDDVTDLLGAG